MADEQKRGQSGRYITVPDIADELGVTRAAVYKWIDEGMIPGVRFGRRVLVLRSDYERFRTQREQAGIAEQQARIAKKEPEIEIMTA